MMETHTPETQYAYILREKDCGHATIAMVDRPEAQRENAKEIARGLRQGMRVERVPMEEARAAIGEAMAFKHTAKGKCSVYKVPA